MCTLVLCTYILMCTKYACLSVNICIQCSTEWLCIYSIMCWNNVPTHYNTMTLFRIIVNYIYNMYVLYCSTYICMYNDIYIHVHSVPYSKMYSDCIVLWMQVRWTVCTTFRSRMGPLATATPPSSRTSWMAT